MSFETTTCPRCESTSTAHMPESIGFNQWRCNQCSHQWDFASPEERAVVPNHLAGGRIEQFLEEFLAIKAAIRSEAEKIWDSCAKAAHQATSIAGKEDKPRVFAEHVDRWRDHLIRLQEGLIIDRLVPLGAKYQISSNEQMWLFQACHEAWSPVTAGYVDWFTFAIRGQLYVAAPWVIPEWAWLLRGAPRPLAHLDVRPDEKYSALLHCLEGTLEHDLVAHRKGAIAKAFLARKPGEPPRGAAEYLFRSKDPEQCFLPPKTQGSPTLAKVATAQSEEASVSEASELFFAWWPSSSFPSPGWPVVVQKFRDAHRILTTKGFLIVADPENALGDGKSWVLQCKPTARLPKGADPADLATQCLESEGVETDSVVQLDEGDRTIYVSLSPLPKPITSIEVQKEPRTDRRTQLLEKIYGVDVAKLSKISSAAITKEWKDGHGGENPTMDYVARETIKRAEQALGVRQTPSPQPAWPLSTFETTVGRLMVDARKACPMKYLPQTEILKIADLLDNQKIPVRRNLERHAGRTMAEYNQQHPLAAIKSWRNAVSHPQFRRAVRKRFSRAEAKYKKATPSIANPSAGTPRTTI
jgi:hypothetical protein